MGLRTMWVRVTAQGSLLSQSLSFLLQARLKSLSDVKVIKTILRSLSLVERCDFLEDEA